MLFDNASCCFVLFVHQFWKVFPKAITEERRKNKWSRECVSAKHWGHTSLSDYLVLKRDIFVARMLRITLYWNIVILISHLIWKGNSYTIWTVSGVKPCFKILVTAVGATKNFFNSKLYTYLVEMVSSFSSLSGHREGGFSDTYLEEVRPKWRVKGVLSWNL